MGELPNNARVVVIGGSAVGTSALYHLAMAGWKDCVLLEKNELTSGSTWHAAGNVPTFSTAWSQMHMQRYSADIYRKLAKKVDYPMNYHVIGSNRLAHSSERMQEFERARGMGRYQGIEIDMCDLSDLKNLYRFLETHNLTGGLYDPHDGDIDPAQLSQVMAKGTRDLGAKIIRFCPVEGVSRQNGEWILTTPKSEIKADIVVNAAGYPAQELARMFIPFGGGELPMKTMSHQYMRTDEIPELFEWCKTTGENLPPLRDVDNSFYMRQERNGLNLGPYERDCKAHWMTADDPMPADFSFQLYSDDLESLEGDMNDAMARVPMLGKACVFTLGIAQAGRMNLAYFCDTRGRVMTEMLILRHADDDFTLITATAAQWHDYELLKAHLPTDVTLRDATEESAPIIVSGPRSRVRLAETCDAEPAQPWFSIQYTKFGAAQTALIRVPNAGELRWEIHAKHAAMPGIYAALLAGGAKPFGMYALNALRLEKGYRAWKADLSSDYSALESGLDRFIRLDKAADFPGKAALQLEKQQGVTKRFATLIIDAEKCDAPYMSTLCHDGKVVGETTSGGWGHRIDKSIALGMLQADLAVEGTEIEVEIYVQRHKAIVQADQPLWDPKNERLRA